MAQSRFALVAAAALAVATLLSGCERPSMDTHQIGFRGTGMERVDNPRILASQASRHVAPPALDPADSAGPKASQVYQNVKVLGDLSVGEFTRVMIAMSSWVAPEQGCVYCHNPANFADDSMQTKNVSRRMLQMTQEINGNWKNHVADTGVTCYTCHRGKNVPEYKWYADPPAPTAGRMLGNDFGQNKAGKKSVGNASLPYDPFTPYLLGKDEIRVTATTALPVNAQVPLKQAEVTHGLMIHMSEALGVGCVHCHNSRAFAEWSQSPPERVQAWHGIRMVRDLNTLFMLPLTPGQPAERLGRTGDIAKINCETCHQGANKPLNGAKMLTAHPELAKPSAPPAKTSELIAPALIDAMRATR